MSNCESISVSMVLPVEMTRWMWAVKDDLGKCRQSYFLSVREDFELPVLRFEKSYEKINTRLWLDPKSVPEF